MYHHHFCSINKGISIHLKSKHCKYKKFKNNLIFHLLPSPTLTLIQENKKSNLLSHPPRSSSSSWKSRSSAKISFSPKVRPEASWVSPLGSVSIIRISLGSLTDLAANCNQNTFSDLFCKKIGRLFPYLNRFMFFIFIS